MWQPIETAPRDGTDILVCYPPYLDHEGEGMWGVASYDVERQRWGMWWDTADRDHQWPTHWMHLPKPPEAGDEP